MSKNILIFKTSTKEIFADLLKLTKEDELTRYCLIQSSSFDEYVNQYPDIIFINIQKESFYELEQRIISEVRNIHFSSIYIPVTPVKAYNFGNIMEIIKNCNYDEIVFFHNRESVKTIKKMPEWKEKIYAFYLNCFKNVYELKNRGK